MNRYLETSYMHNFICLNVGFAIYFHLLHASDEIIAFVTQYEKKLMNMSLFYMSPFIIRFIK